MNKKTRKHGNLGPLGTATKTIEQNGMAFFFVRKKLVRKKTLGGGGVSMTWRRVNKLSHQARSPPRLPLASKLGKWQRTQLVTISKQDIYLCLCTLLSGMKFIAE